MTSNLSRSALLPRIPSSGRGLEQESTGRTPKAGLPGYDATIQQSKTTQPFTAIEFPPFDRDAAPARGWRRARAPHLGSPSSVGACVPFATPASGAASTEALLFVFRLLQRSSTMVGTGSAPASAPHALFSRASTAIFVNYKSSPIQRVFTLVEPPLRSSLRTALPLSAPLRTPARPVLTLLIA